MTLVAKRGDEILRRLPSGEVSGVEVGVWDGRLSQYLLSKNEQLRLIMVDRWQDVPETHRYRQSKSQMAQSSAEDFACIHGKAMRVVNRYARRAQPMKGESVDMAALVQDASMDFAFIDADHSYDGVMEDLKAWFPKLKPGGLLCGHDWDHPDHIGRWGVKEAVEEFTSKLPGTIETGNNRTWFLKWA